MLVADPNLQYQEREELVRKGILTPFHKLKGFERRLQQPSPSSSHDMCGEDTNEDLASATVAKTARSISEVARARPTTKLLDAQALPKLEAPTHPFRRLQIPLKFSKSLSEKKQEDKGHKLSKRRRPLPDKKWRKVVSREEKLALEIGTHINLYFGEMITSLPLEVWDCMV